MPTGKHAEYARKVAKQFYQQRGIENPALLGERTEEVKDTTRYNPENGSLLTEPRPFNLMLKTYVGPVESADNMSYLRPETAQAIFVQFKNTLDVSRQRVPFGICQIGKAFRNEINPRNFTFRSREFEQMELEFFIRPDEVVQKMAGSVASLSDPQPSTLNPQPNWGWELWHKYWVEQRIKWYESIGLGRDTLVEYWQKKEELAHYAKATVDILFKFPFGTQELEGIAARGDFDLTQHQKFSGKSMEYFDEEAKAKYVPHVIEPSAGVDRLALALICNAYCEDQAPDEKGKMESRVVMKFHPRIAPIKVAVFPLLKNKPELVKKAKAVRDLLRPHMSVFYDEAGAIGRRYRRQDEAGTPFGVTIDFDTLGEKGPELQDTVTLRDRDTHEAGTSEDRRSGVYVAGEDPVMGTDTELVKKRAPTLYAIIAIKLLKGLLFVTLAIVAYTLSDNDLPAEYQNLLQHLRLNPERKFWADLAVQVGQLTEAKVLWTAAGTLVYSLFSLVEGVGLDVPRELGRLDGDRGIGLLHPHRDLRTGAPDSPGARLVRATPVTVLVILVINIVIVWYLLQNRQRLFRHHHH